METVNYSNMDEIVNMLNDLGYRVERSNEGKLYDTAMGIEFPCIKFESDRVIKHHGIPKDWEYFSHDKTIRFIVKSNISNDIMNYVKNYAMNTLNNWLYNIQSRIYYSYD